MGRAGKMGFGAGFGLSTLGSGFIGFGQKTRIENGLEFCVSEPFTFRVRALVYIFRAACFGLELY